MIVSDKTTEESGQRVSPLERLLELPGFTKYQEARRVRVQPIT